MAPSLKIVSFVVVAAVLLMATPQARALLDRELEEHDQVPDMVPVQSSSPAGKVLVPIPGAAGTTAGSPVCLQCRCCSKSSPGNCQITTCCSSFNCDPAGKCHLVPGKCGCSGCGGAAH